MSSVIASLVEGKLDIPVPPVGMLSFAFTIEKETKEFRVAEFEAISGIFETFGKPSFPFPWPCRRR